MNFSKDRNTDIGTDKLMSDADKELGRAMRSLKRVDAPSDFEFRLKARIADAAPFRNRGPRLSPVLIYLLPVIVLSGIAGFFLIRQSPPETSAALEQAPARASLLDEQYNASSGPDRTPSPESLAANTALAATEQQRTAANAAARTVARETVPAANKTESGTSFDTAIESSKPILPRGIDPSSAVSANAAAPASAVLGVAQILRILGIEARYGASGWKVTSVATDSMSDRAGVKMGDVIEAIDDRKLGEKTTFDRTISIKQLNVLRGGARVKIVIGGR